MKRLVVTAASLFVSVSAYAADPVYVDPAPAAAPIAAYDWSGFYAGLHAGYGVASMNGLFDNGGAPGGPYNLSTIDPDGFLGGVHIGYNWQWDQLVFGIEGDVTGAALKDGATGAPSAGQTINIAAEVDLLASIRARAGLAIDNLLLYGTVGAGYANYKFTSTFSPLVGTGSLSDNGWGVVFGGGAEYAHGNWLFRLEALHYNVTPSRAFAAASIPDADAGDFVNYKGITTVRAGISYKF